MVEIIQKRAFSFFFIARGSIYELETQLYISFDQKYIDDLVLQSTLLKLETTRKLLNGFIKYYQQLVK
ncbi:four helix bundle protein [Pedobacter sp.]|uniref:four helix bundle protein n=1 Tax=Pedobacter sp. TaxID=1411316 RepID=UPI003BAA67DB